MNAFSGLFDFAARVSVGYCRSALWLVKLNQHITATPRTIQRMTGEKDWIKRVTNTIICALLAIIACWSLYDLIHNPGNWRYSFVPDQIGFYNRFEEDQFELIRF